MNKSTQIIPYSLCLVAFVAFTAGCIGNLNLSGPGEGTVGPAPSAEALLVKDFFFLPTTSWKNSYKTTTKTSFTINGQKTDTSDVATRTDEVTGYTGSVATVKGSTTTTTISGGGSKTKTEGKIATITLNTDGSVNSKDDKGEDFTYTPTIFTATGATFKKGSQLVKYIYVAKDPITAAGKAYEAYKFKIDISDASSSVDPDGTTVESTASITGFAWAAKGTGLLKVDAAGSLAIRVKTSDGPVSGTGTISIVEELVSGAF